MLAIGRHDAASRAELNSVYEAVIADVRDCLCFHICTGLAIPEKMVFFLPPPFGRGSQGERSEHCALVVVNVFSDSAANCVNLFV